jgi:RNA polymerase sigma-70 factor, ECF subfamily
VEVETMQSNKARRPDLAHDPDEDLVALVRRGEGEAFRAIMQRYNRRLYRIARGVVRDDGEAEDVVQEAYVRAYAALGCVFRLNVIAISSPR